ncbi:MAG: putative quinol monooxygenase [Janthinobacterium lividum]
MTSTSAFVVIAEFRVKPGMVDAFVALARIDANGSVANETGCRSFETLVTEDDPELLVLHEVYDDRAAFELHLQQPHYFTFRDGVLAVQASEPTVRFFTQLG